MKVRDVVRGLEAAGWRKVDQRGDHRYFEHPSLPGKVTVSGGWNEDMKPGTLASVRQQSGLRRLGR